MDLLRLEQQRQTLEQNLLELRQSLKHWQQLDVEYEGLKEELQDTLTHLDAAALESLAATYNADLITPYEIRKMAGLDDNVPRTPQQIAGLIQHRQEYVQKNIETVQRRFFDAEAKLETFDFAASRDSETGLPLTEIHEELDDDDNVISSRLSQPESAQSKLLDSLRQAGLADDDLEGFAKDVKASATVTPLKPAITNISPPISPGAAIADPKPSPGLLVEEDGPPPGRGPSRKKSVSFTADTKSPPEVVRADSDEGRKSVSFAEKVAIAPAAPLPDTRSVSFSPKIVEIPADPVATLSPELNPKSAAQTEYQKDLRNSFKPGEEVIEIGDDDEVVAKHIVLPEIESAEDAQTRREMLDYHLHEVGHVVAQIDLDEAFAEDAEDEEDDDTSTHWTGSTRPDDEDTPYTSGFSDEEDEDDYSEDELGRSKQLALSSDYHKRMQDLQAKLIGNIGPAPGDTDVADSELEINPDDVRRLVIREKPSSTSSLASDASSDKKTTGKKRVSFASSVDVEPEPGSPPLKAQKHQAGENVPPFTSSIPERTTAMAHSMPSPPKTVVGPDNSMTSTFSPPSSVEETPNGPAGETLVDTLVERPAVASVAAPSEDDPDSLIQRRELAAEYYRRRNNLIKQQGGFKRDEDDEETLGPLMEEKDGKAKKVSRFKAARLKG